MLIVNSPISINISLYTHLINYIFSFISYFISKTAQYFGTSCMSYQNIMFMHIYCHVTGDCTMDIQDLCFKSPFYLLHSNQSNHHWIKTFYFLLPHICKSSISIRWTSILQKMTHLNINLEMIIYQTLQNQYIQTQIKIKSSENYNKLMYITVYL